MLKLRRVTEVVGLPVYTDAGEYVGEVEELNIVENKIESWKIRVVKSSTLAVQLGGAKGVIVPHTYVKAIGDVMVISRSIAPRGEEKLEEEFE
ncbi:MAG: PRC-barrel domain-containing protein [Candidatus Pacearchaeota archaeon]